jgi:hypothetical protein
MEGFQTGPANQDVGTLTWLMWFATQGTQSKNDMVRVDLKEKPKTILEYKVAPLVVVDRWKAKDRREQEKH